MITIGVHMGGPEQTDSPIENALMTTMRAAARVRSSDYKESGEGWINPIFIVPGSILQPPFSGFELGHFSKRQKGVVVKIAVPQSVADGHGIVDFIVDALRHACSIAAKFFLEKRISFSALKADKIITEIEKSLSQGR